MRGTGGGRGENSKLKFQREKGLFLEWKEKKKQLAWKCPINVAFDLRLKKWDKEA